jgi:uncharacterized protein (DUF1499 family)
MIQHRMKALALPLLSLVALYLVTRFMLIPMFSPLPDNLGLQADGHLADCPHNNNCVSSFARMADLAHYVVPLQFEGSIEEAREQVTTLLQEQMMVNVISSSGDYIHAEYRTAFWGFIDDLELYFDEDASMIYVRSASRLGGNDFGANRQRIELLRNDLATLLGWDQR